MGACNSLVNPEGSMLRKKINKKNGFFMIHMNYCVTFLFAYVFLPISFTSAVIGFTVDASVLPAVCQSV